MIAALLSISLIAGCTSSHTPEPAEPVANVEPPEQVGAAPVPSDSSDVAAPTPASLYGLCRARVEGPEAPAECTTDAECGRTGCSQEVCAPIAKAGDVMTTCEILPCFRALDTCGCQEGVCSWSLKTELPGPGPLRLPKK